jgi:hypothetical protein
VCIDHGQQPVQFFLIHFKQVNKTFDGSERTAKIMCRTVNEIVKLRFLLLQLLIYEFNFIKVAYA